MREMLAVTPRLSVKGSAKKWGSSPTADFPAARTGWWSVVAPEAQDGVPSRPSRPATLSPLTRKRKCCVHLTDSELKARLKKFKAPKLKYKSGVLYKYARNVTSAAFGALTDWEPKN